jgi:hypothetical protein
LEVNYYCNDLSLSFLFLFLPRRTSNLREVRFEEVAVLKQISALHHKNSWKFSEYLFISNFLCACPRLYPNFH